MPVRDEGLLHDLAPLMPGALLRRRTRVASSSSSSSTSCPSSCRVDPVEAPPARGAVSTFRAVDEVQDDDQGRPEPPLAGTEAETLVGFLEFQRATLAWRTGGLDDAQLRAPLHPTDMTLGGMLLHLARVEEGWFTEVVDEQPLGEPWATAPWGQEWQTAHARTGEELRATWRASVERSRDVVQRALDAGGLDATHPAWGGQGHPSLRWVLVHMVEEYARHNGHADLLRQALDGQVGE